MSDGKQCRTCCFAKGKECHRYPPVNLGTGETQWPIVDPLDWCGEYHGDSFGRAFAEARKYFGVLLAIASLGSHVGSR